MCLDVAPERELPTNAEINISFSTTKRDENTIYKSARERRRCGCVVVRINTCPMASCCGVDELLVTWGKFVVRSRVREEMGWCHFIGLMFQVDRIVAIGIAKLLRRLHLQFLVNSYSFR